MNRLRTQRFNRFRSIATLILNDNQNVISWLQHHLLPCPFKWATGIDCPGCGFQRALLLLFQGQWKASIQQYPPTIPLLLLGIFFILKHYYDFKHSEKLSILLSCLVGGIIIAAYLEKML